MIFSDTQQRNTNNNKTPVCWESALSRECSFSAVALGRQGRLSAVGFYSPAAQANMLAILYV